MDAAGRQQRGARNRKHRAAIDDEARDVRAVENHYLMDAMTATSEGQPIDQAVTKSIGCTIKWAD